MVEKLRRVWEGRPCSGLKCLVSGPADRYNCKVNCFFFIFTLALEYITADNAEPHSEKQAPETIIPDVSIHA